MTAADQAAAADANGTEPGRSGSVQAAVAAMLACQQANGALVASPDFEQYHYCWLRDSSFAAYALDRCGEHDASARYHDWASAAIAGIGAADRYRQSQRRIAGRVHRPAPASADAIQPGRHRSRPTTGRTSRSTATGPGCGRCASTSAGPSASSCRPGSRRLGAAGGALPRRVRARRLLRRLGRERRWRARLDAGLRLRRAHRGRLPAGRAGPAAAGPRDPVARTDDGRRRGPILQVQREHGRRRQHDLAGRRRSP